MNTLFPRWLTPETHTWQIKKSLCHCLHHWLVVVVAVVSSNCLYIFVCVDVEMWMKCMCVVCDCRVRIWFRAQPREREEEEEEEKIEWRFRCGNEMVDSHTIDWMSASASSLSLFLSFSLVLSLTLLWKLITGWERPYIHISIPILIPILSIGESLRGMSGLDRQIRLHLRIH